MPKIKDFDLPCDEELIAEAMDDLKELIPHYFDNTLPKDFPRWGNRDTLIEAIKNNCEVIAELVNKDGNEDDYDEGDYDV